LSDEREEYASWWQALAQDPDYYTNTEQGQKELADMIRKESERLLEEIGKSVKRTKEIIWLSNFCTSCHHFRQEGRKTTCNSEGNPFKGRKRRKGGRCRGDRLGRPLEGGLREDSGYGRGDGKRRIPILLLQGNVDSAQSHLFM
jgi:hypothetical protein